MMRRKRISLAIGTVVVLALVFTTAFANRATIDDRGVNRYKSLRLTPEIYNHANSDLSDVRIVDAKGETVPYFIHSGYQTIATETAYFPLALIHAYDKDDAFYFDYTLTESYDFDILATALVFTTSDVNFAKNVEVYGSHDDIHWTFLQRDLLYQVSDKAKLEIAFDGAQKYTHYRLILENNLERIAFRTADLVYSQAATQSHYFIEGLTPGFRTEEVDQSTHIYIDGLKNLRLSGIMIDTDSMFMRTVEAPSLSVRKELYNLSFGDTLYRDTTMPLLARTSREDSLVLMISNGDDRPIDVAGIRVWYYADELIFEGDGNGGEGESKSKGEGYTLHFGADSDAQAPVYDIARYKDEILKGDIDRLGMRDVRIEEIAPAPEPRDYRVLFNAVVIGVAVLLGVLIIVKLRSGGMMNGR